MLNDSDSLDTGTLGVEIRKEFPVFETDRAVAYLDSAASAQKPRKVIDSMSDMMSYHYANIHRGAYRLSAESTQSYSDARATVARFIGATDERCIVFTRGATESINLVAYCLSRQLKEGDAVITTLIEHHSNIVPWELACKRSGADLFFVGMRDDATIDMQDLETKLKQHKPRLLAITGLSNAFGTKTPLKQIIEMAHSVGTLVLVDASQLVTHYPVDVAELDADFLVFSSHKIYGPTGIGVLYGKYDLLEAFEPFQGGGDMIQEVTTEGSTWAEVPRKFEAGTPAIVEAVGLAAALDFVSAIGFKAIMAHERDLFCYGYERLTSEDGVTVYGPGPESGGQSCVLPFVVENVHPHDLASIADNFGVQIRAGNHCAMPALRALNLQATGRASLGVYNAREDFDKLLTAIQEAKKIFA